VFTPSRVHTFTCSVDNNISIQYYSRVVTVAHMPSPSASLVATVTAAEHHACHNSSSLQQETRALTQKKLSLAQKATLSLQKASTHAKAEQLATDLDFILTRHTSELEVFARDHDTDLEYIKKITSHSSHYKKKRAVTIQNAMLHLKSLEVNAGTYTLHYCAYKKS
jgi:hypothetical protein